jgi:hypothetical protein
MKKKLKSIMTIMRICLLFSPLTLYADQTIINNNSQAPYPIQPQCNNGYGTSGNGLPPGTYQIQNGNGTSSTVYTTGDKQPYIVDNNCNQNQNIQPYVYVQPPMPGPWKRMPEPLKGQMQSPMQGQMPDTNSGSFPRPMTHP